MTKPEEPIQPKNPQYQDIFSFKRQVFHQYKWLEEFTTSKPWLQGRSYLLAKRVMDLMMVSLSMPFLLPLYAICALLIKLEDPKGPVFFKQKRTGKGGLRFGMYKFRSMVYNAEELKQKYAHLNELQWPDFKVKNDPRVTRIGRILRKTSIDEMPQLLNILQGDMSMVGPRPTSFQANTYDLWQTQRLDATPGITGLYQILGRGRLEFIDRVYLDIFYIEHRCMWLDIQILLRTVLVMVVQKGVH